MCGAWTLAKQQVIGAKYKYRHAENSKCTVDYIASQQSQLESQKYGSWYVLIATNMNNHNHNFSFLLY